MALVEIDVNVTRIGAHGALYAVDGADVTVQNADGSARAVYADQAGQIVIPQPLKSRNGRIDGYVELGTYLRYRALHPSLTANPPWEYFVAGGPRGIQGPVGGQVPNAAGDGITDDTAALNAAFAAGGTWDLTERYRITGTLTLRDNLTVRLSADAVIDAREVPAGSPWASVAGSVSNATALSANAAEADTALSVAAGAETAFAAGDLVRVRSERQPDTAQPKDGELHFVESVASGQVNLEGGLWDAYATANTATVEKVNAPRNIILEGGKVIGAGVANTHGVNFELCRDVRVRGVTFEGFAQRTVQLVSCVLANVEDNFVYWANQSGFGYGVLASAACQWVNITGNTFVDCRHGVVGGGSSAAYGRPRHIVVDANQFYGGLDAGVDSHSAGQHWVISNNVIECGGAGANDGIVWQGTDVSITDNTVLNAKRHGIFVQVLRPDAVRALVVSGNTVRNARSVGVYVVGEAAGSAIGGLVVADNSVYRAGSDGIMVRTLTGAGATLAHFAITGNVVLGTVAGRGIFVRSDAGAVSWGTVSGNRAEVTAVAEAIYLYTPTAGNVSRVAVTGNTANGGSYGIRGVNHANCFVDGNIALGSTAGLAGFAAAELGANMTA